MRKSLLVLLGAFVLCGAVLVGCNNKVEPVKPEPSPTPTPVVQTKQVFPFGAQLKIAGQLFKNGFTCRKTAGTSADFALDVVLCDKDGNELTEYTNVLWSLEVKQGDFSLSTDKGYKTVVSAIGNADDAALIQCKDEENNVISCTIIYEY